MASKVINITPDKKSGKRAKSASPTTKQGSASTSQSTSIIDNILKDRAASTGTNSPGKKLIIDLANDNFILTDAKHSGANISKPQPIKPLVSKTIDRVIIDIDPTEFGSNKSKSKTKSSNLADEDFGDEPMNIDDVSAEPDLVTGKSGVRKSTSPATPAGALGNSVVSREKMNKLQALDAVFLRSTPSPIPADDLVASLGSPTQKSKPKSTDPLDFVFNELAPTSVQSNKSLSPISIIPTKQPQSPFPSTLQSHQSEIKVIRPIGSSPLPITSKSANMAPTANSGDIELTRQKLESVNRNMVKIQQKINEKGAKEKYVVMLKDLEKQKQKYEGRLSTSTKSSSPQPLYPPPTYKESMLGTPNKLNANPPTNPIINSNPSPRTNPIPEKPKSPQLLNTNHKKLSLDERLATDQELARIRELFPDASKNSNGNSGMGKNMSWPKEVQSLFNVSNNIETLREKQRHLEQQHKKLEEKYAHKMKQIDRMRTQKEEMTKLSALEIERRKIYEMEQKLKRLDKEQWEEQQRLRKELQTINLVNLQAISRNNNKDVGEFYSLKQQLSDDNSKQGIRTTAISPVNIRPSDKVTLFRLADWFAGFMWSDKSSGKKKYEPESFKEVDLGSQQILESQKAITGYHYYNVELPSTDWEEQTEPLSNTNTQVRKSAEWQDYHIGDGQVAINIKSCITNDLIAQNNQILIPVVEQICQLSSQLGSADTILIAKGLDFIADKLETGSSTNYQPDARGKLLDMLTGLLNNITCRLVISQID